MREKRCHDLKLLDDSEVNKLCNNILNKSENATHIFQLKNSYHFTF